MYQEHFGLTRPPFKITPDTSLFFEGSQRGAALDALMYAINSGEGIIKVVGEVGSGKTMLCRMLEVRLPDNIDVIYIANPSLSPDNILHVIAHELHLDVASEMSKVSVMQRIQAHLLKKHADNQQVVLFVEEAQSMPIETLEEIRLLSNLETDENKLLQMVLFGQPELDEKLSAPQIRQLKERITHSFNLSPFPPDDTLQYLNFRLRAVGYKGPDVFNKKTAGVVKKYSDGLTRRINIIADKSLLAAFSEGGHTVTPSHIKLAAQDSEFKRAGNKNYLYFAGGFVLLVAALITGYLMGSRNMENQILPGMAGSRAMQEQLPILPGMAGSRAMHVSMDGRYKGNAGAIAEEQVEHEQVESDSDSIEQERLKQVLPDSTQQATTAQAESAQYPLTKNNNRQNNAMRSGIAERLEKTEQWLAEAIDNHYSIQLFLARISYADKVEAFLEKVPETLDFTKIYIYETVINGHEWYSVLYNDFATYSNAIESLDSLPPSLKASGAYLRRVRGLEKRQRAQSIMIIKNKIKQIKHACFATVIAITVVACGATNPPTISQGHIKSTPDKSADKALIPQPVTQVPALPRPGKRKKLETYTVVVNQVPIRELLFSMARDADLNLDIDNDISGKITMNAIDQTLPKILQRIESQSAISYFLEDGTLKVRADKPYLHVYNIDYLNISRASGGNVSISTEIGATSSGVQSGSGGGNKSSGGSGDNTANSKIENKSINEFWNTITKNIGGIIEQDINPRAGSKVESSSNIIVNRESGIIAVRATGKKHKLVKKFIGQVVGSAQRQVLIEATIAEVALSDKYQAGIDWSLIGEDTSGIQNVIGGSLGAAPVFQLASSGTINGNPLNITLKALESFGDVKVLSSPKVMTLNNQTAILKVVDNEVYFNIDVNVVPGNTNTNSVTTVDTTVNTVPVGIVMAVTPFIDEGGTVTLNVRPTISRIIDYVDDPNPLLAEAEVVSQIPVIQVREIETMLTVDDSETAIIGGLMQDQINKENRGVPILSSIPLLGALFSYTEEKYVKSELVIFIRPVVIENASLDGDLADYKKYLLEDLQQATSEKLSDQ